MMGICMYELVRPESELTEEDWMRYFVEAKTSDNSRSLTLKKAMRNLQMTQGYDGNTEWIVLSAKNFDEEEPELCIQYLVNAFRPPVLQAHGRGPGYLEQLVDSLQGTSSYSDIRIGSR
ncbi:hypothetical protein ABG067_003495 [Albugo candida]